MHNPVMQVTDAKGEVFWMDGHDLEDALAAFGSDVEVKFFIAIPSEDFEDVMSEQ